MSISVEIRGLEEFQRKMEQMTADVTGSPMVETMREATLLVQRDAKLNLRPWRGPGTGGVDTGRLRASIVPEIRSGLGASVIEGVVGSNVFYAPYQELGFRAHFVSEDHIGTWAERHGLGRRGVFVSGKALKFLERAFKSNKQRIEQLFDTTIGRIVRK